jgi:hypothetical protein
VEPSLQAVGREEEGEVCVVAGPSSVEVSDWTGLDGNVRRELDATRTILVGKNGQETISMGNPSGRVTVRRSLPSSRDAIERVVVALKARGRLMAMPAQTTGALVRTPVSMNMRPATPANFESFDHIANLLESRRASS